MRSSLTLVLSLSVILFGSLVGGGHARADGDPAKGLKVFNKCAICHSAGAAGGAQTGLDLTDVFGRRVAAAPNFDFSAALRAFGADGKTWDDALLARFLADPGGVVPGTNMAFVGLKREDETRHLIAFLKSLTPAAPGP
ncbi:c-type cytochrome [Azospirillum griseum]|uniref:C-type cytochrome n=1 Tax=Azospirillum griseum TaxID=2496639 RepID=A0A3S0HUS7_9PROT|nr:c-type cytochrome [Azospirillum griseum]RTR16553.1 c-type cytochrome [Azospirillum griseum]